MCDRAATFDTQLYIRHGSVLVLECPSWLATLQMAGEYLLDCSLLDALGFNSHMTLSAGGDRCGGSVDVSALFTNKATSSSRRVGDILNGILHTNGDGNEANVNEKDDGRLDFGYENPSEKQEVVQTKLQEAKDSSVSRTGCKDLESHATSSETGSSSSLTKFNPSSSNLFASS